MVLNCLLISSHKASESNGAVTIQIVRHAHLTFTSLYIKSTVCRAPSLALQDSLELSPVFYSNSPGVGGGFWGSCCGPCQLLVYQSQRLCHGTVRNPHWVSPAGNKCIRPGLCFIIVAVLKSTKKPTAGSPQLCCSQYSSPVLRKQDKEAWSASNQAAQPHLSPSLH